MQLSGSSLNFPHFKQKVHVNGKRRHQLALESRLLRVVSTAAGWAGPPRPLSPPRTPPPLQPVRPSAQQLVCGKAALQIARLKLLFGTQLHSKKTQKSRPQPRLAIMASLARSAKDSQSSRLVLLEHGSLCRWMLKIQITQLAQSVKKWSKMSMGTPPPALSPAPLAFCKPRWLQV